MLRFDEACDAGFANHSNSPSPPREEKGLGDEEVSWVETSFCFRRNFRFTPQSILMLFEGKKGISTRSKTLCLQGKP